MSHTARELQTSGMHSHIQDLHCVQKNVILDAIY